MRNRIAAAAALLALIAGPVAAHEGHEHKVMGTIKAVEAGRLMVTTSDEKTHQEKTLTISLTEKTKYRRGETAANKGALHAGERVVVSVGNGKEPLKATEVRLAAK